MDVTKPVALRAARLIVAQCPAGQRLLNSGNCLSSEHFSLAGLAAAAARASLQLPPMVTVVADAVAICPRRGDDENCPPCPPPGCTADIRQGFSEASCTALLILLRQQVFGKTLACTLTHSAVHVVLHG